MSPLRSIASAALAALGCTAFAAATPNLPSLGTDPQQTSVSGLSSGAFMAVQLQVAYSGSIVGSGIVAGGPYYCAANNPMFTAVCMGQVPFVPPNPSLMLQSAKHFAKDGRIDPLEHLQDRRVYVFSGTRDLVVRPQAVNATAGFFQQAGVRSENLSYVNDLPAGHAVITGDYGNDCATNATPYINHCIIDGHHYDQAGAVLGHIYGKLRPRVKKPGGQILAFNQREFAAPGTGLAETGYLYVPKSCVSASASCKLHIAIHGCDQGAESVGDRFYLHTGYNHWADSNGIVVLYPQVHKSLLPINPTGCWDWWGYTGADYAQKSGVQMKAIMEMVDRLAQRP